MVAFAKQSYIVSCDICDKKFSIQAYPQDMREWENGALIQNAMPYLTTKEREILTSRTCDYCFEEMFGDYSEDE